MKFPPRTIFPCKVEPRPDFKSLPIKSSGTVLTCRYCGALRVVVNTIYFAQRLRLRRLRRYLVLMKEESLATLPRKEKIRLCSTLPKSQGIMRDPIELEIFKNIY